MYCCHKKSYILSYLRNMSFNPILYQIMHNYKSHSYRLEPEAGCLLYN